MKAAVSGTREDEALASESGSGVASAPAGPAGRGKVPLRARLHAWWEGRELAAESSIADAPPRAEAETPPPARETDAAGWSHGRIRAAQMLWGDGETHPAGSQGVIDMVKPVGLDPSKSVLELGAGLGEGARVVVQTLGAWVTGLESSPTLAEKAMERSVMAGLAKKAPVTACDPENLDLPARAYDCIFAREAFYTVADKGQLIRSVVKALKSNGELVFTDYMLRAPDLDTDAIARWLAGEPVPARPWSVDEAVETLRQHRLDVRVTEDVSAAFRTRVVQGLEDLINRHRKAPPLEPRLAELLLSEAELWARRVEAIDGGDLRLYRIFARKLDMDSEGLKTLSEW